MSPSPPPEPPPPEPSPPPAGTARLFPGSPGGVPLDAAHRSHLIARLLEEGDGTDLAWLTAEVGEEELAAWLRRRGGRALSHRSRVFWERVLGVEAGGAHAAAGDLWPTANPPARP